LIVYIALSLSFQISIISSLDFLWQIDFLCIMYYISNFSMVL
jgi:hypothetical protein